MTAAIIRIAFLVGLAFGGYKLYPKLKPVIQPILARPRVLGAEIATPVIDSINKILPDSINIPTATPTTTTTPNTESDTTISPLNNIIDEVKQKANEVAQNQIDTVKKETSNAFCAALIETIKKQCGVQ